MCYSMVLLYALAVNLARGTQGLQNTRAVPQKWNALLRPTGQKSALETSCTPGEIYKSVPTWSLYCNKACKKLYHV